MKDFYIETIILTCGATAVEPAMTANAAKIIILFIFYFFFQSVNLAPK